MKYGLLSYADIAPFSSGNVGDYIQSLAAIQFLPRIDIFVERENMHGVAGQGDIFLIMNGWFMHRPENFPPPKNIHPFYISFCVADERMLSSEAIDHLKQFAPIGCRDLQTMRLLRSHNIPTYYSGCLTLSFPPFRGAKNKYVYALEASERILLTMPLALQKHLRFVSHEAMVFRKINDLLNAKRTRFFKAGFLNKVLDLLYFLGILVPYAVWRFLPRERSGNTWSSMLNLARAYTLLGRYKRASLLLTTRLHGALPCIAFGTPVVFFRPSFKEAHDRFTALGEHLAPYSTDADMIDWSPVAPDCDSQRSFLRLLTEEAVRLQKNPLKDKDIDWFYEKSGWHPPSFSL